MRHNRKGPGLSRKSGHKRAMMANMASSLIKHKRIETTVPKAKALRMYVEPVVTKAKDDSTHTRRIAFSYLRDKNAVIELFKVVAPAVGERPGGYTRILKTGFRKGDSADMCIIELVDFNEAYNLGAVKKSKRTRRGGAAATGAEGEVTTEAKKEVAVSAKKAEPKKEAAPKKTAAPKAKKAEPKPEK